MTTNNTPLHTESTPSAEPLLDSEPLHQSETINSSPHENTTHHLIEHSPSTSLKRDQISSDRSHITQQVDNHSPNTSVMNSAEPQNDPHHFDPSRKAGDRERDFSISNADKHNTADKKIDHTAPEEIRLPTQTERRPETHPNEAINSEHQESHREYEPNQVLPVGFDLISIFYYLSQDESLLTQDLHLKLMDGKIRVDIHLDVKPMIRLTFNANNLSDKHAYMPQSLAQYADNFVQVESAVQASVLSTFTIDKCAISRIEIFKTVAIQHNTLDYSSAINMLNVKGAYLKKQKFHSEGSSTFSLKNGQNEIIFYDKHLELQEKVKGKKEILDDLPENMMRIEWKLKHPFAVRNRLGGLMCLDLLNKYTFVTDRYFAFCKTILPEIPNTLDIEINFASTNMQSLCDQIRPFCGKQALRNATEIMLAYYLVHHNDLERFYDTKKFEYEQNRALNARIKRWIPLVAYIGTVKCIDLYNELKGKVLDGSDIVSSSNDR